MASFDQILTGMPDRRRNKCFQNRPCRLGDRQLKRYANLDPNVPLIADADTGYGGMVLYAKASLKRG
jgi:isocitrate lyase